MAIAKIFLDTLFIIALINGRDQYHERAVKVADQYNNQPLITTDAVLLEVGNALARSYRAQAAQVIEDLLSSDDVEIVHLTPNLLHRAFHLYKAHQDKEWGLVDCVSFVVMQEADVAAALTFDRHFVQAGFQALLRNE